VLGRIGVWLMGVAAMLLFASAAQAEGRVALVIANSTYAHAPRLPNPPNDARTIAAALRKVGFTTTEKSDLSKAGLEAALKVFAQSARGADVAVIYYAGHGMEQGGLNYLVPVDAALASDQDVEFDAVPLDLLLRSVEGASRMKLVILDACRNNPFLSSMRRSGGTRAVGRGLARVEPAGDILVAYAAREGSTADDGDGGNSPFTTALTQRIATPGLEIRLLFGQVRDEVLRSTDRRQEPAIYGSLGGDPFYFVAPAPQPVAVAAAPPAPKGKAGRAQDPATADMKVAALTAQRAGDTGQALAQYAKALALNPKDGEALYNRGLLYLNQSKYDLAIADFDAVLAIRPRWGGGYHARSRAREGRDDLDGAIADASKAIQFAPQNSSGYEARARYYRRQGKWDLALADYTSALGLQPDSDGYYQRGLAYQGKGDEAAARADFDKALALQPNNSRAQAARDRLDKK